MTYSGYEMQLAEKDARIESLRQQLTAAKEETTIDEQRVADLMGQVGELSNQLSSRDAEVAELNGMVSEIQSARHVQREHNDLLVKNHKLSEQVTLLRDALLTLRGRALYLDFQFDTGAVDEALASTEPKP